MKTLIRVQTQSDSGYNQMTVQILVHPYKNSDSIHVIGHLSFQQTKGEDHWYALRFNTSTDSAEDLVKMAKLAKFIKNNTPYDAQPEDIFKAIGAVKYAVFQQEWVPVSKAGENLYNVYTSAGTLYSRIVAPDEKAAKKVLKKRKIGEGEMAPVEVILVSKIVL